MTAVILAAGRGTRMGGNVPKQFLEVGGEPILARTVRVFEESSVISRIVLVASSDYIRFCREEIVRKNGFQKVAAVIEGGRERYESVWNALLYLKENGCGDRDCVCIHDGARPFVTEEILLRVEEAVRACGTAVAAMPSKDTVKIADEEEFVVTTPDRRKVWMIQTPQAFSFGLIYQANKKLRAENGMSGITDDAMIVERSGLARVKLVRGSWSNIKVTTPEDLRFLK